MPGTAQRVTVFIDAQNTYRAARQAFAGDVGHYLVGQFNPLGLAERLTGSGRPGVERKLKEVRIYSGRPDATRSPRTYAAHMRQCAAWEASGVTVIARSLLYPRGWPQEKEREKGIDVAMAIDFVALAIDDEYDVGILVSVDTDLVPALEYVARKFSGVKSAEVAAWRSESARRRLFVRGFNVWCHWLDMEAYHEVSDPTDYRL